MVNGLTQKGTTQIGITQIGVTRKGITQIGITQIGITRKGIMQLGITRKAITQIVNMNSPQMLSQDILSGRRMLRPLEHHLLRVLTKKYEESCCSNFAHAQFLHMATDYFA